MELLNTRVDAAHGRRIVVAREYMSDGIALHRIILSLKVRDTRVA